MHNKSMQAIRYLLANIFEVVTKNETMQIGQRSLINEMKYMVETIK